MALQPLPQVALTVARMRQMAHDMLLEADKLEAEAGLCDHLPRKSVEFEFSREKRNGRKKVKD